MAVKKGWTDLGNGMVQGPADYYGGVVDINHPIYTNYQEPATSATEQGGGYQAAPGTPTNQDEAAKAASTYSSTPTAAPSANTTNQGSQDLYRNALIEKMNQNPIPDQNDQAIAAQQVPYAAAVERARADEVRRGAESAFAGNQDYGNPEKQVMAERAGQAIGLHASDLVGREIQARRAEIMAALSQFGGVLTGDQQRALQDKLAQLDAQLRREGLGAQTSLGQSDLALREKLGMGGLNLEALRAILQNQQFGQDLGFRIGSENANLNAQALRSLFQ